MTELNSTQIKEKIQNGETFLLDFYATWCGPCKLLIPNLEKIESELLEKNIPIFKYNVESDMAYSSEMGVRGVPTLHYYDKGVKKNSQAGLMNPNQIKQFVGI